MTTPVRDFHMHSNCSDGLFDPTELVRYAWRSGVEEISLTDHDTIAGLDEAQVAADEVGVRFVPGIELTCKHGNITVHILGYGFRTSVASADRWLTDYLTGLKERDLAYARKMCAMTCENPLIVKTPDGGKHHVCVKPEEIGPGRGSMTSPIHIAMVLAAKLGKISPGLQIPPRHCMYLFTGRPEPERRGESYWPELRQRYVDQLKPFAISPGTRWWIQREKDDLLSADQAIAAITGMGGLPVLAHPGEQRLSAEYIRSIAALGVKGIEVYTFKHGPGLISQLEDLASELGLFTTAGTDFHDPHHRAQVAPGQDREGRYLRDGVSADDLVGIP